MDQTRLVQHKLRNGIQAGLLVLALGGLCAWLAWFIGGMPLALLTAGFILLFYQLNPAASPEMVVRLFRGQILTPAQAPELYRVLY